MMKETLQPELNKAEKRIFERQLIILRIVTILGISTLLFLLLNSNILKYQLNNQFINPMDGYGTPTVGYFG
ncbi:MAG: hypothetical protein NVSMB46_03730 [Candidatus Saccharimonadales bacterium]